MVELLESQDTLEITVDTADTGQRLDRYLSDQLPELSRARVQALIKSGHVRLLDANRALNRSGKVSSDETYQVTIPEPEEATPQAQAIDLDIVYEDEDLLVLNKPAGMVVHPAPGHSSATLVNALLGHCGTSLSGIGGVKRPGIVHRLDKDTSGLMVVAKNDQAHHRLSSQFSDRSLSRTYMALVWGIPQKSSGTIDAPVGRSSHNRQKMAVTARGSKNAVTHYTVLKTFIQNGSLSTAISLVECKLETGRTHQIRVHMTHLGHPLLGDPLYGKTPKLAKKQWGEEITSFPRQALHAKEITFIHPKTDEQVNFSSGLPKDFEDLLAQAN